MSRVVASIEARMGASRLPGKVMEDIAGAPMIAHVVARLRRCRHLDGIILATTTNPDDDVLARWAEAESVPVHRGSEDDVLGRVLGAHAAMDSEIVVEVCGDTPLIDADVIDMAVRTFEESDCDVVSNTRKLSFPQGADAQVFRRADLDEVGRTVDDPAVREHVSLHFYEHPEQYRVVHLQAPPRWHAPEIRLQVDYPEDLEFVRAVYARLDGGRAGRFGIEEILDLLRAEPDLRAINAHCEERAPR